VNRDSWGFSAVIVAATLGGLMVWSLSDFRLPHNEIAVLLIAIGVVIFWRTVANRNSRRREYRHKQNWDGGNYHPTANLPTDYGAIINEARAYREARENENKDRKSAETLTIIGVFIAGAIAYLQWNALEKTDVTLGKQDETTRLRDRAFVYFNGTEVQPYPANSPVVWGAIIGISNTGNMAANRLTVRFACPITERTSFVQDPFAIATQWRKLDFPNVIGPKQFLGPLQLRGCETAITDINEAKKHQRVIYLALEIQYLDGFEAQKMRVTRMGRIYQFDDFDGFSMGFAGPNNCSDDDCPK
jgi:hypothetical protein